MALRSCSKSSTIWAQWQGLDTGWSTFSTIHWLAVGLAVADNVADNADNDANGNVADNTGNVAGNTDNVADNTDMLADNTDELDRGRGPDARGGRVGQNLG